MGDDRFDVRGVGRGAGYSGDDAPPMPPPTDGSADRTKRQLAYARSDTYYASGVAAGSCDLPQGGLFGKNGLFGPNCRSPADYEHYDYDACGNEAVDHAALYLREPGDVAEIDAKDVRQKDMGDCHLMAALVALAHTPEGRARIKGAIVETTDARGEISYTVTFHQRRLLDPSKFDDVKVTVRAEFAHGHAVPRDASDQKEIWPLVMERAYAEFMHGYNRIARGGLPANAMEALTGNMVERYESLSTHRSYPATPGEGPAPTYSAERLKSDLAACKMIVLETPHSLHQGYDEYNLAGGHAYAVLGFSEDGEGKLFLLLKNPWNTTLDEPYPVPFDQLTRWFSAVDVGAVK